MRMLLKKGNVNLLQQIEDQDELIRNTLKFLYYFEKGEHKNAEKYEKQKIIFPILGMEDYFRALLYKKLNHPSKDIVKLLINCIKTNPKFLEAYIELSQFCILIGKDQEALNIFKLGEKLYHKEGELPYNLLFVLSYAEILYKFKQINFPSIKKADEFLKYSREKLLKKEIYESYITDDLIKTIQKYLELNCCLYRYKKEDLIVYINKPIVNEIYEGDIKNS